MRKGGSSADEDESILALLQKQYIDHPVERDGYPSSGLRVMNLKA